MRSPPLACVPEASRRAESSNFGEPTRKALSVMGTGCIAPAPHPGSRVARKRRRASGLCVCVSVIMKPAERTLV